MRAQKEWGLRIGNCRKRRACYRASKTSAELQLCPKTSGGQNLKP